jgi:hypothetical protein
MWLLKIISCLIKVIIQNVLIFNLLQILFCSVFINTCVAVIVMNLARLMLRPASLIYHFRSINVNPLYSSLYPSLTTFFMHFSSTFLYMLNYLQEEPTMTRLV